MSRCHWLTAKEAKRFVCDLKGLSPSRVAFAEIILLLTHQGASFLVISKSPALLWPWEEPAASQPPLTFTWAGPVSCPLKWAGELDLRCLKSDVVWSPNHSLGIGAPCPAT